MKARELTGIALMAGFTAVMAQLQIPMPLGVPMTMQTMAVTIAAVTFGAKGGALSMIVYLLLGVMGLPVFAGMTGGVQVVFSPTGGFLISFPLMAYLVGLGADGIRKTDDKLNLRFLIMLICGTFLNFAAGAIFFMVVTGSGPEAALAGCVIPFIPAAIVKAALGTLIGIRLRRRLEKI